jgi:hypothetical protein
LARAKRTDRTEARRRYRADQAPVLGEGEDDAAAYPSDNAAASTRRRGTAPESTSARSAAPGVRPERPGFAASAKAAYHAPHLSDDLRHLPRLLIHWSVLVSAAIAVIGSALLITQSSVTAADGTQTATTLGYIGSMAFSLFVGPPAFGAALLMGFMLPRASYLVGLAYGVLGSVLFVVVFASLQSVPQPSGVSVQYGIDQYAFALVLMVVGTMFFTAGIAWYRRFLDLLNPARAQRAQAQKKAQAQGRGNAPRNRLSGPNR